MNTLISFTRSTSSLQRAAAKRTTTSYRSFSSTLATHDAPQKLTGEEVAASVRLLTYQGTPFPWVAVSNEINWSMVVVTEVTALIGLKYLISRHCLVAFLHFVTVSDKRKQINNENLCFHGLQSSVVFYESNGVVGRKNGPSSRMAERIQSSGSDIDDTWCRWRLPKGM